MDEGSRGEIFRCGGVLTGLGQLIKGVFPLVLVAFPTHGATCHVSPSGDNLHEGSANRIAELFTRGLLDQEARVNHTSFALGVILRKVAKQNWGLYKSGAPHSDSPFWSAAANRTRKRIDAKISRIPPSLAERSINADRKE